MTKTEPLKNSLISVIIAAYNAQDTLEKCIRSVCAQTHSEIEILIVDDKSTDHTRKKAEKLKNEDNRIRLLEMPQNGGPGAARNMALESARGEWIAVVDSDDTIGPDRLEKMLSSASDHKVDIVFDNLVYHPLGNRENYNYLADDLPVFGALPAQTYIRSGCLTDPLPNLGFLKPFIRREMIEAAKIRYDENLRVGEDCMLILDLFAYGAKAWLLREPLYHYYKHKNSISSVFDKNRIQSIKNAVTTYRKKNEEKMNSETRAAVSEFESDLIRVLQAKELLEPLSIAALRRAASQAWSERETRPHLLRELRHQVKRRIKG